MAILKVARMGHPVLRQASNPVTTEEVQTPAFQSFIADMIETMREYEGVGLAAPQVHRNIRVCVVELPEEMQGRRSKISGLQVFINPKWEFLSQETASYWEGCLSVPGLRGLVARPQKIKVNYLDQQGKEKEFVAEGFLATVLQHEFDHLDGKLYIDRLVDSTKLLFDQEFERYLSKSGEEVLD